MDLTEQLEYCRKCKHRENPTTSVLLCGLTHAWPEFADYCKDYIYDHTEPEECLDDCHHISQSEIEKNLGNDIYKRLRSEQKFVKAIVLGLAASFLGAVIWALLSFATGYQFGIMAIGVGALVGFTIKFAGKGFELKFAIASALLALLGCGSGNFLTIVINASKEYDVGILQILSTLDIKTIIRALIETFRITDIFFYGIAIYEAYRFATIKFTRKTLWSATRKYEVEV